MAIDASLTHDQWMRFVYMRDRGHLQFLEKAEKCDAFTVGDQWAEQDLSALKLARRPAITINKILSTLSTVMGEQIYNRNEVLFRPAKGGLAPTAEALTKVWKQIEQNNQLSWLRSDVFCDGIIRGRGFYDMRLDFTDSMQGELRLSLLNSKNVLIDPDAEEYDPDSWNDVITTKWMTPQDIEILYNKDDADYLRDKEGSSFMFGYDSIERTRDRFSGNYLQHAYYGQMEQIGVRRNIRTLDRQYRKITKQEHFVDIQTGDMRPIPDGWDRDRISLLLEKAGGQLSTTKKTVKRIRWTVTADTCVLHDDWSPYKHFTVVPFFPFFRYGRTVGLVENLLGPQELLNKTTSQELHVINTTANSGWIIKSGNLVNMSVEDVEQSGAKTGLVLEVEDISQIEKIQPNAMPTGLDRLSYKAEEAVKSISGVSDSMQGFDREDVAAKAIAYKQQRGSVNLTKMMDNLERTDYLLARNALDLIQSYYTEPRLLQIIGDDATQAPEQLEVNGFNAETGEITNDLTLGEYEIVITSQPHRATLEDSQFEQARALRELGIAIPDSVLIENSRLMRKADIIKQMEGDKTSPEAQAKAALQQRAQEAEVAQMEAGVQKTIADTQKVAAEAQGGDMAEMEREQAKLQMEERRLEMELQAKREELDMKREEMQMKLQLQQEQHAQDMHIKEQTAAHDAQLKEEQMQQQAAATALGAAKAENSPPTATTEK